jgi:two-component system, chemotaxis family, chemotaxis protein CheY
METYQHESLRRAGDDMSWTSTCLVIDASTSMRSFTAQRFRDLGLQVFEAANTRQAIDYLERFGPLDLALIDCRTANAAYDFVRAVRSSSHYESMKLIVIAAACDALRLPDLLEAGADSYLLKPFDRETIIARLTTLGVMQAHRAPRGELWCEL